MTNNFRDYNIVSIALTISGNKAIPNEKQRAKSTKT